jgi:hypothetical protein
MSINAVKYIIASEIGLLATNALGRNAFLLLTQRLQALGGKWQSQVRRLQAEWPFGLFRGNVVAVLLVVPSVVLQEFSWNTMKEVTPELPLEVRHFLATMFVRAVLFPLRVVQIRMNLAHPNTTYPDLIYDHLLPRKVLRNTQPMEYWLQVARNFYNGIFLHLAHLAALSATSSLLKLTCSTCFPSIQKLSVQYPDIYNRGIFALSTIFWYPISTLELRMQSGNYTSLTECIQAVLRENGVTTLWNGIGTYVFFMGLDECRQWCTRKLFLSFLSINNQS